MGTGFRTRSCANTGLRQNGAGVSKINPDPFTTRPVIDGTFGVVASTHWIATAVGMGMLERGGNAFDAAVATAFTLQVVEPHLNGPGGDVPVILYDSARRIEVICGQGAPAAATIERYKGFGLDIIPGTGLLAACVPGTFETWMLLLRDYGTMRLADVLSPAIYYAGEGHPLVERASFTIGTVQQLFRDYWPTSAAVYLPTIPCRRPANCSPTRLSRRPMPASCARPKVWAEIASADRACAQDVVAGFCRRSDRQILPHAGSHGCQRPPQSRRPHRR